MLAGISDRILSLHGWVALAIVFALPALEASAFIGFLFPGEIAVLLGGVLAYEGRISVSAAVVAAVLGAFVGDNIGYVVGRRWGRSILRRVVGRVPIVKHRVEEHLDSAEDYLQRRGPRAVVIGRFTAALRVLVPGLAGMAGLPYGTFALFNAIGAVVWGTLFVLIGYFAGAAWARAAGYAGRIGFGLLALILIGLVAGRLLRRMRDHGERLPDRLARIRPAAWVRRRFPSFSSWLARRVYASDPRGFVLSLVVAAGALCAWLFGGLMQDALRNEEAVHLDIGVERFWVAHRTGWLTAVLKALTWLGSTELLILLVAAGVAFLLQRRGDWRGSALMVASLAGSIVLYDVAKAIVRRPRPPVAFQLLHLSGSAFPSGHATAAAAVWGAMAIAIGVGRSRRAKLLLGSAAALIALMVAFSRLYLGVHWFTDVVAGLALGGAWLACLVALLLVTTSSRPAPTNEGAPRKRDEAPSAADRTRFRPARSS